MPGTLRVATTSRARADIFNELAQVQDRLRALRAQLERSEGLDDAADTLEVLACTAGEQTVAFPLAPIERVVLAATLVPLPGTPPWVPGVLALEGQEIPVIDVLARFRACAREIQLSDVIVVANLGDARVGLMVQDASGVCTVPRSSLQPLTEPGDIAPYVLATAPVQDRTGMLLSIAALAAPLQAQEAHQK